MSRATFGPMTDVTETWELGTRRVSPNKIHGSPPRKDESVLEGPIFLSRGGGTRNSRCVRTTRYS